MDIDEIIKNSAKREIFSFDTVFLYVNYCLKISAEKFLKVLMVLRGLKVLKWLRVLTRGKTASSTDRLDKVLRVLRVLRFFESTKIGLDLRFKVYLLTANC